MIGNITVQPALVYLLTFASHVTFEIIKGTKLIQERFREVMIITKVFWYILNIISSFHISKKEGNKKGNPFLRMRGRSFLSGRFLSGDKLSLIETCNNLFLRNSLFDHEFFVNFNRIRSMIDIDYLHTNQEWFW